MTRYDCNICEEPLDGNESELPEFRGSCRACAFDYQHNQENYLDWDPVTQTWVPTLAMRYESYSHYRVCNDRVTEHNRYDLPEFAGLCGPCSFSALTDNDPDLFPTRFCIECGEPADETDITDVFPLCRDCDVTTAQYDAEVPRRRRYCIACTEINWAEEDREYPPSNCGCYNPDDDDDPHYAELEFEAEEQEEDEVDELPF